MFDLRYHVASLAAVFLALILGILVGVAISDPGLADRADKQALRDQIDRLNERVRDESARSRQQEAAEAFVNASYTAIMEGRLDRKRIVVISIGSVDATLDAALTALRDADAELAGLRALTVPLRADDLEQAVAARPALAKYVGKDHLSDLGRDLGRELIAGEEMPLWDALTNQLIEQRSGSLERPVHGVVVHRSTSAQQGDTARFLHGFYEGLEGPAPVVGVEASSSSPSAIDAYRRAGFSSVDAIDTAPGRVALAVLLAGGKPGHYGLKASAQQMLPPIEPVALPASPRD